jgi:O-antigen/teichoic acid export membrane protein
MMFPAFSKLDAEKDNEPLRNIFQFSVKYASLLVVPAAALVMCLAVPAVDTLFGNTYNAAPLFLALLAVPYLYTAFGTLSLGGFLNGQGHTSYVLKMAVLTGFIGFPMGYIAILNFGVLGLIAASLLAGIPSLFIGLRFIRKTYGVTVDWSSSVKILVSSAIAASVTYAAISAITFSSWVELILGVVIFIIVLVPSALITKSINRSDVSNLRGMTSGLGGVGKLLSKVLNVLEKLIGILKL